jgi:hypothetical protein
MGLPTLEEFLKDATKRGAWPARGYVREEGFKDLYVRYVTHYIGRRKRKMLDLANMNASRPGRGAFTALMRKLVLLYPHLSIYVECVLQERFAKTLVERFGFKPVSHDIRSFYLLR